MKPRVFDPSRLDVAAFAQAGAALSGEWPLADFKRLAACRPTEVLQQPAQPVDWKAVGELRRKRGAQPEIWLHLKASTSLPLECQRCLRPVIDTLVVERSLRFVVNEAVAAELDAEMEDDVLALTRSLDLRVLVEDELLLALPIVPRHDVCSRPLRPPQVEPEPESEPRQNPFAALQALKRESPESNSH